MPVMQSLNGRHVTVNSPRNIPGCCQVFYYIPTTEQVTGEISPGYADSYIASIILSYCRNCPELLSPMRAAVFSLLQPVSWTVAVYFLQQKYAVITDV